jgi:hypothetical protein
MRCNGVVSLAPLEFGDPRAVAVAAVGVDRLYPRRFRDLDDRGAGRFATLVADREADPSLTEVAGERVRLTADVVRTRISR